MKIKSSYDIAGFTLLELIIAMAIFGIVVAMIVSLQLFGVKSFHAGSTQSDVQNDLRLVANRISEEVRYAENFQIYSTIPTFDNQYKYIYLDPLDHLMKLRVGNGTPIVLAGALGAVTLTFSTTSSRLIHFTISEAKNNQDFNIQSDIDLFNLGSNSILGTSSGTVIRFGPISDLEIVTQDKNDLKLGITETSGNITLPVTGPAGSTISWSVVGTSPYLSILGSVGTVTRPPLGSADILVTITATIAKNAEALTKDFVITIKAQNLDSVTMDVGNGTLSNTTSSMYYRIETGAWIQASEGTTNVIFTSGSVQVRDAANTTNREVGVIPESDVAPIGVTISNDNSNAAIFNVGVSRALATDNLEYNLNSSGWIDILDSTTVRTHGTNTIIVRLKATSIALPSLETGNLD